MLIALLLGLQAAAPPAPPTELVLEPDSGYVVPVQINGVTLRLRVDPAASLMVILNPDAARRARLRPEIAPPTPYIPGAYLRRAYARIGPVNLTGRTSRASVLVAGRPADLRMIWFGRDAVGAADGIISVASLPFDRIVLRLAPPRPDEAPTVLRLEPSPEMGLYFPYPLGDNVVPVQFSIWRQDNIGTAAAGALLAGGHGGAWRGDHSRQPVNFGIDRPVRPMALGRPMDIAGIRVGRLLVRTGDYRGGLRLPADTADPDEIVVTATGGQPQAARLNLTLGRAQIARCSSIAWEGADRRLTLSCAPE